VLGFGMQDLGAAAARQDTAGASASASAGAGRAGTAEAGPARGIEMWGSSFERHGYLSGGARRGSGAVALSSPASRASRSHPGRGAHFFAAGIPRAGRNPSVPTPSGRQAQQTSG